MKSSFTLVPRDAGAALLLLVAYVAAGVFSLQWTAIQGAGAAIWIPAGIGMAGLMFGGLRLWPAIFIGRMLAAYLTGTQQPFWAEVAFAMGNAATTAAGVWLLQGRSGITPPLSELRSMLRFLWVTALVPAGLAALIGTTTLYFSSRLAPAELPLTWLRWACGNAASILVITALALGWRQQPVPPQDRLGFCAMLVASAVGAACVFMAGPEVPLLAWHLYPLLIWAALRHGVLGAASALLIVESAAIAGVVMGVGPFMLLAPNPVSALFYLQQFLVLTASTILLLAAVALERRDKAALERAQAALRQLNDELERRVHERSEALQRSQTALLQAQKMEALGQLTGGIAHDFNNLLQTISTSFELISRRASSADDVVRYAQTGRKATLRGVKLTRQLLGFSRMQELEMRPVAVKPLLEGMKDLLHSTLGSAVSLDLHLAGTEELHVFSDPTQLELLIINLAVNARDAMPSGGRLALGATEEFVHEDAELGRGAYVRLWVRDTGHGMTPEVAARVFEPFFTTKDVGKGTGLGLSMVYGVAKQSGGSAKIESAPGDGTTVSIILPLAQAPHLPTAEGSERLMPLPSGLKVLLVEDDDGVRASVGDMLATLGCEVRAVETGAAALVWLQEQQQQQHPDLVLLDHTMPGMLGTEFIRRLRSGGITTPIVLATGDARIDPPSVQNLELLRKPYDPAQFQRAALRAMGSM